MLVLKLLFKAVSVVLNLQILANINPEVYGNTHYTATLEHMMFFTVICLQSIYLKRSETKTSNTDLESKASVGFARNLMLFNLYFQLAMVFPLLWYLISLYGPLYRFNQVGLVLTACSSLILIAS